MPKATTVRFTDEMFARLDQASSRTGLPVNSIVVAACLEWMQRHVPAHESRVDIAGMTTLTVPPRWATLRRAVEMAVGQRHHSMYPFDRFTEHAKALLELAQAEAEKSGFPYIGTEHLLLACFGNPDFLSAKVLAALGTEREAANAAIEKAIGLKRPRRRTRIIPTSRVKKVIEVSFEEARRAGDDRVGTGHVLLALLIEGEGIAAHVLTDLGATLTSVRAKIEQLRPDE